MSEKEPTGPCPNSGAWFTRITRGAALAGAIAAAGVPQAGGSRTC